jgi:hypothetical protein
VIHEQPIAGVTVDIYRIGTQEIERVHTFVISYIHIHFGLRQEGEYIFLRTFNKKMIGVLQPHSLMILKLVLLLFIFGLLLSGNSSLTSSFFYHILLLSMFHDLFSLEAFFILPSDFLFWNKHNLVSKTQELSLLLNISEFFKF